MKSSAVSAKTDNWSVRVGEYLIGTLPEMDFFRIAKDSAPNQAVQREQLCEADYYSGMQHLLAGDKAVATTLFQACLATREFDFMEYAGAEAELNAFKSH